MNCFPWNQKQNISHKCLCYHSLLNYTSNLCWEEDRGVWLGAKHYPGTSMDKILSLFFPPKTFMAVGLMSCQPFMFLPTNWSTKVYLIQRKDKYTKPLHWINMCSINVFAKSFITFGPRPILLDPNREHKYPIQLSETLFCENEKYRI